jgi:hypothetical protein
MFKNIWKKEKFNKRLKVKTCIYFDTKIWEIRGEMKIAREKKRRKRKKGKQ